MRIAQSKIPNPQSQGEALFLSPAELKDITDRSHADAQIAWLNAEGFPYQLSGKGRPKVLRSVVLARLGRTAEPREPQVRP